MQPLLLSNDLQVHERSDDCLIVKNIRSKTYMVLNRAEWKILSRYSKPTTILDLFPDLVRDRATPELSELFELLLKARRRFILVTLGTQPPAIIASDWSSKLSYTISHLLSLLAIAFGVISLIFQPQMQIAPNPLLATFFLVLGWVIVCLCLSFGNFLAACLTNWFEREVFDPDWKLATLFPHFRFNMKDLPMGGVLLETGAAQLQVMPVFLFSGIASWLVPQMSIMAIIGMLFSLAPLKGAPATRFLQAVFRGPQRSVTVDFVFDSGRGAMGRLGRSLKQLNHRYYFIETLYSLGWMGLSGYLAYSVFGTGQLGEILSDSYGSEQQTLISTIVLSVLGVTILVLGLNKLFTKIQSLFKKAENTTLQAVEEEKLDFSSIDKSHIEDLILAMPFAQKLTFDLVKQLAARAQHNVYAPNQVIYDFGDQLNHYPIVLLGRLSIEQESRSGKLYEVRSVSPGETFGEDELLDERATDYRVRSTEETCIVFIDKEAFKKHVVSRVGRQRIQEMMQKEGLLNDIRFSKNWEKETIQRFAKLCVVNEYHDGSIVLPEEFDNRFFYIIYQGIFLVRKRRKPVAKLRRGDFFGEISLLQNSPTTSEVLSEERGKAFTISKGDFLRFMVTDFRVALQIERIASKRLGYPVFPLKRRR